MVHIPLRSSDRVKGGSCHISVGYGKENEQLSTLTKCHNNPMVAGIAKAVLWCLGVSSILIHAPLRSSDRAKIAPCYLLIGYGKKHE